MPKVDWSEIYKQDFVAITDCWKTCGGYCCKNFFGKFLAGLDKSSVSIPMTAEEFQFFKSIGGIKNITADARERRFTLENGKSFTLYFLSCNCAGLCDPHSSRPLICRIYPYFPVVNVKGEILDFDYCSLMDIFYKAPETTHKCTLVKTTQLRKEVKENLTLAFSSLLADPYLIFLFMLNKLAIDRFREAMKLTIDQMSEDELSSFFKKYEWYLLTGKPWRNAIFQRQATETYEAVRDTWNRDFL